MFYIFKYKLQAVSLVLLSILLTQSCDKKRSIIITKEYVYRDNTYQSGKSGFTINYIIPEDEETPPKSYSIVDSLSYTFVADSQFNWEKKKIHFNEVQQGFFWVPINDRRQRIKTIGELKNNSWYMFNRLSHGGIYYFVYIDEKGNVKQFYVNRTNW